MMLQKISVIETNLFALFETKQMQLGTYIIAITKLDSEVKSGLTLLLEEKEGLYEGPFLKRELACSDITPAVVLEKLSKDKNWDVRYRVADNENTPAAVLVELTKDDNIIVREFAKNKLYDMGVKF